MLNQLGLADAELDNAAALEEMAELDAKAASAATAELEAAGALDEAAAELDAAAMLDEIGALLLAASLEETELLDDNALLETAELLAGAAELLAGATEAKPPTGRTNWNALELATGIAASDDEATADELLEMALELLMALASELLAAGVEAE